MAGYREKGNGLIDENAEAMIPTVIERIRFELGLRYYTDYLSGGSYFTDLSPAEKLSRARAYLEN